MHFRRLAVMGFVVALLLGLAASAVWAGPVSAKLTKDELAKVTAGQIIAKNEIAQGSESGYGVAYGIIKGDVEDFWKVIMDHEHYLEFYPRLKGVSIVERDPSKAVITFKMDVTISTVEYTTIGIITPDRMKMTWTQDNGRPHKYFKKNDGHWILEQLEPGVILVEYKVDVALDLGPFSKVATKVVNIMAKDDLPEVVRATKLRMESGGTWKRK